MKKKKRMIITIIIILLIMITGILIYLSRVANPQKSSAKTNEIVMQETGQDAEKEKLSQMQEGDRIRYYVGKYMKHIEKKEYESAYYLLYSPFKEKYFPTLEDYKNYIEACHFPEVLSIDYKEIVTRGEYYMIKIEVGNLLNTTTRKTEVTIILKENNYNDFVLSFKKNLGE